MTIEKEQQQTLSWIKGELYKRDIKPSKRLGQNFLIDQNILEFIVNTGMIESNDVVLEIGAGTGALTRLLAAKAGHVLAIEIDNKLFEFAQKTVSLTKNVTILNRDALKNKNHMDPDIFKRARDLIDNAVSMHDNGGQSRKPELKAISNLPYCVSTPIIVGLLESGLPIKQMIFMLQKEITHRLAAEPGSKDYGILSIISQYFGEIEELKHLPPNIFWPNPKVASAIVQIIVRDKENLQPITNYQTFQKIIRAIFTSRRKTIHNSLKRMEIESITTDKIDTALTNANIDQITRGETLSVDQIIQLANEIEKACC